MKESHRSFSPRNFAATATALLAALFLSAGVSAGVRAQQDERATQQTPEARREREAQRRGGEGAAGLLRALNLSPEQRAQIAAIRRETEPQGRLLGARLRQARRALDEAIYSANPDERVVEERTREVAAAQAAIMRLRTFTELKIRRVLSPEQLNAFRRLQGQPRARRRLNQPSPQQQQDDFPGDDAPPAARRRNRRERRRLEQQQQQQLPPSNDPNDLPPSAPREQRRRAPLRDARPPRR